MNKTAAAVSFLLCIFAININTAFGQVQLEAQTPLEFVRCAAPNSTVGFSLELKNSGTQGVFIYSAILLVTLYDENQMFELYPASGLYMIPAQSSKHISTQVTLPSETGIYRVVLLVFDAFTDSRIFSFFSPKLFFIDASDNDNDGMCDSWETFFGTNPDTADAHIDIENDGLLNSEEFFLGIHPRIADSDEDGITDSDELIHNTCPADYYDAFKLLSLQKNTANSSMALTWQTPLYGKRTYKIYWRQSIDSAWDQIDYAGWESSVVDNGNFSRSWNDEGADAEMSGVQPFHASRRYYKVEME